MVSDLRICASAKYSKTVKVFSEWGWNLHLWANSIIFPKKIIPWTGRPLTREFAIYVFRGGASWASGDHLSPTKIDIGDLIKWSELYLTWNCRHGSAYILQLRFDVTLCLFIWPYSRIFLTRLELWSWNWRGQASHESLVLGFQKIKNSYIPKTPKLLLNNPLTLINFKSKIYNI